MVALLNGHINCICCVMLARYKTITFISSFVVPQAAEVPGSGTAAAVGGAHLRPRLLGPALLPHRPAQVTQYTVHSTQYTVHSTQYTVHSSPPTLTWPGDGLPRTGIWSCQRTFANFSRFLLEIG